MSVAGVVLPHCCYQLFLHVTHNALLKLFVDDALRSHIDIICFTVPEFVHNVLEAKPGGGKYVEAVLQYAADQDLNDASLLVKLAADVAGGAKMKVHF